MRRGAFAKNAVEIHIMPPRREIYEIVRISVGTDESRDGHKRQIGAVQRMCEQQRVAGRRFDRPKVIEFDDELVVIKERRACDLGAVVVGER